MAVLTYGFAALSVLLVLDGAFAASGMAGALPWFTAAAAAFSGFLIAVVWYFDIRKRQRAKKHRTKALAAICVNLAACIMAVAQQLIGMIRLLV